jgi:2-dehydro-3-deoxyphosphogluconate aldolase/(4S)-4-hydroxy-2-oxoglutarate aldolase
VEETKVIQQIDRDGLIAIIRTDSPEPVLDIVAALVNGGIRVIELTMTTPNAMDSIKDIYHHFGDELLLGLGTVLDGDDALAAINLGISFIVTPVYVDQVVDTCRKNSTLVIPGCYTPLEMFTAWRKGSNLLKYFPAGIGGPKMLKSVLAPLPELKIVPTGGVNLTNMKDFFDSGAIAVGVGGDLVRRTWVSRSEYDAIEKAAQKFMKEVQEINTFEG